MVRGIVRNLRLRPHPDLARCTSSSVAFASRKMYNTTFERDLRQRCWLRPLIQHPLNMRLPIQRNNVIHSVSVSKKLCFCLLLPAFVGKLYKYRCF